MDCDTIWIQKWIPESEDHIVNFGHCFGSMRSAPGSMCRGTLEHRAKYWKVNYLRVSGEPILLASPFRIPASSPFLKESIKFLEGLIGQSVKWDGKYNVFMTFAAVCLEII